MLAERAAALPLRNTGLSELGSTNPTAFQVGRGAVAGVADPGDTAPPIRFDRIRPMQIV
ncbi:MAG: hypothetical protein SynsKO_11870 [Synoicihabitans sp.]